MFHLAYDTYSGVSQCGEQEPGPVAKACRTHNISLVDCRRCLLAVTRRGLVAQIRLNELDASEESP